MCWLRPLEPLKVGQRQCRIVSKIDGCYRRKFHKSSKMELYISFLVLLSLISAGFALECYVCQNQPDNKDKCVKTSVQCREEQDTCMTHIEWRAPDFWTPRSEKIHYVHKSCNTASFCSQQQRNVGLKCMRDWYRDWECYECCQGDRCNFYVTLGASAQFPSIITLITSLAVILVVWRR